METSHVPDGASSTCVSREERIARRLTEILHLPGGTTLKEDEDGPYLVIPGRRLRRYVDRKRTPLAWHRFVLYFCLPLGIVYFIWKMLTIYSTIHSAIYFDPFVQNYPQFKAIFVAAILYFLLSFVPSLATFLLLIHWHRAGIWIYLSTVVVSIVLSVYSLAYKAATGAPDADTALIQLAFSVPLYVIITVQLFIYYTKRSLLFSPRYREISDALNVKLDPSESGGAAEYAWCQFTTTCPSCGARVIVGERTCETCGARMDSER